MKAQFASLATAVTIVLIYDGLHLLVKEFKGTFRNVQLHVVTCVSCRLSNFLLIGLNIFILAKLIVATF